MRSQILLPYSYCMSSQGLHYVSVNETDLLEVLDGLEQRDPADHAAIAEHAQSFAYK